MRLAALLSPVILAACAAPTVQQKAGVLDYLYPEGVSSEPPSDVKLTLPLRVGLAFAPTTGNLEGMRPFWTADFGGYAPVFGETEKQRLLERVQAAFQDTEGVRSIEIIPSSFLKLGGGFENVDQLRSLLGIDLIALLSFEQTQFQEYKKASLTYWTLVGGYFIEGNENETQTFVDTSVFDISSRALLFNAAGRSKIEHDSTILEVAETLRADSSKGFESAIDDMIGELQGALTAFREQAKSGTVRGAGTPKISVEGGGEGGTGAGASGALELGLALALAGGWIRRRRGRA